MVSRQNDDLRQDLKHWLECWVGAC